MPLDVTIVMERKGEAVMRGSCKPELTLAETFA
jgi:hypothetical protein